MLSLRQLLGLLEMLIPISCLMPRDIAGIDITLCMTEHSRDLKSRDIYSFFTQLRNILHKHEHQSLKPLGENENLEKLSCLETQYASVRHH